MTIDEILEDEGKCKELCKKLKEEKVKTSTLRFCEIFEKMFGISCVAHNVSYHNSAKGRKKLAHIGIKVRNVVFYYYSVSGIARVIKEWRYTNYTSKWEMIL